MKMWLERSRSLDVFRGLTVALMILVNNPGSWTEIYAPFEHAPWHGLTPTDLVFPFFLFAVGNALAIVMPRLTLQKIFKRTLMVFLIGLCLNWYPFFLWVGDTLTFKGWTWIDVHGNLAGLRVFGVLQRIALAYGFAATLAYFFPKRALVMSAVILASYWGLTLALGAPGDPYSLEGFFGTTFDRAVLLPHHLYQGEGVAFDPEGIMSTIPSIAQVLMGYWVGAKLITEGAQNFLKKILPGMIVFIVLGGIWSFFFPLNKKIWTSSYVLVTTGLATMLLMLLVKVIDVNQNKNRSWTWFEAFGKNPLFIFVLSAFVPKTMALIRIPENGGYLTPLSWFYTHVCALFPGDPKNGSLLYAVVIVLVYALIARILDRKKVYIRV
jgi:predicted acyltransferase